MAHDDEVRRFSEALDKAEIRFVPVPYDKLWADWLDRGSDELREHASALIERYSVVVPEAA